jgi:hypothetical protein
MKTSWLLLALLIPASVPAAVDAFRPGEIWQDTAGQPINAHGGGVLYHEGTYYWYGEFKEGLTYMPACNQSWGGTRVDVKGVSCYSSKDLLNWKNEGLVLKAVPDDVEHDLHPLKVVERPKVVYNRLTKKFVMWLHADSMDYSYAAAGVATADSPTGPFRYRASVRPHAGVWPENVTAADKVVDAANPKNTPLARDFSRGQMARDQTVFVDDDGKAYHFYSSEENATTHVAELTPDYLAHTGRYRRIFPDRSMEAAVVFKRAGKYYFIASGCTAWEPNAARAAVADSPMGPWKELGNPCVGPDSELTFRLQSTHAIVLPGPEARVIVLFDRWKQWDLPDSRYAWLPATFTADGRIEIRWRDRWTLADGFAPAKP